MPQTKILVDIGVPQATAAAQTSFVNLFRMLATLSVSRFFQSPRRVRGRA
jgi:hypothetical protein